MTKNQARLLISTRLDDRGGFTTTELSNEVGLLRRVDRQALVQACHDMTRRDARQTVWASKTGHRTVRYFGRPEWAAAHLAVTPTNTDTVSFRIARRPSWDPALPAITTPHTRYTYAPLPPARVLHTNTHPIW